MTDIKSIELSEKLLNSKMKNRQFIRLVDDMVKNPKHLELYTLMKDLRTYYDLKDVKRSN